MSELIQHKSLKALYLNLLITVLLLVISEALGLAIETHISHGDNSVEFVVSFSLKSDVRISWYKDEDQIAFFRADKQGRIVYKRPMTRGLVITLVKTGHSNHVKAILKVFNPKCENQGKYRCTVEGEKDGRKSASNVKSLEIETVLPSQPVIQLTNGGDIGSVNTTFQARSNTTIRLICLADVGNPPGILTLSYRDVIATEYKNIKCEQCFEVKRIEAGCNNQKQGSFEITLMPTDDGKVIRCNVKQIKPNTLSLSSEVVIRVLYPPFTEHAYHAVNQTVNSNVILRCAIKGNPALQISWYHKGIRMKEDRPKYEMKLTQQASGNYTCRGCNTFDGRNECSYEHFSVDINGVLSDEQQDSENNKTLIVIIGSASFLLITTIVIAVITKYSKTFKKVPLTSESGEHENCASPLTITRQEHPDDNYEQEFHDVTPMLNTKYPARRDLRHQGIKENKHSTENVDLGYMQPLSSRKINSDTIPKSFKTYLKGLKPEQGKTIRNLFINIEKLIFCSETIIGEGHFGKVYAAQYHRTKSQWEKVAVKVLKEVDSIGEPIHRKYLEAFLEEAAQMSKCNHPNILCLIGVAFQPDSMPVVVLPYMHLGDLKQYVENHKQDIELLDILRFCYDIVSGMAYMSKLELVHRDLAARNCMLDEGMTVKVADFGLCRDIYGKDYYRVTNMDQKLPIKWMALESLRDHRFSIKSDVWSFGIVIFELYTYCEHAPYHDVPIYSPIDLLQHIQSGNRPYRPADCPTEIYELMEKCLSEQTEDRPTFSHLVQRFSHLLRIPYSSDNAGMNTRFLEGSSLKLGRTNSFQGTLERKNDFAMDI